MVEEMLAIRGIVVSRKTIRRWAEKFGRNYTRRLRLHAPGRSDKWQLDEVVVGIASVKHWLWPAVDGNGFVLDVFLRKQCEAPCVMITYKLGSYTAAKGEPLRCVKSAVSSARYSRWTG
jgi:putative transposase